MAHMKEYTELAVQIGKLMERAEDLKRDNDSLRAALAEKTAHVERLREALTNIHDYGIDRDGETTSEKLGELVDELVQLARESSISYIGVDVMEKRLHGDPDRIIEHMEFLSATLAERAKDIARLYTQNDLLVSQVERLRSLLVWAMTYVEADHKRGPNLPLEEALAKEAREIIAASKL